MKTSVVVAALILAFSSAQASEVGSAVAKSNVISEDVRSSLAGLPAVEIPAKAAKIVKAASDESRLATAKSILKEVLNHRPQLAVQMTASIVRTAPETAPFVASWAAAMVPQFSDQIIRAAAVSAPGYAADIAVAAIRIFPSSKTKIIQMVALAVPASAAKIETAFTGAPARLTFGAVAQEASTGGTIVTYNGLPIGYVAPVSPKIDVTDPTDPTQTDPVDPPEPELVFFPDSLANVVQVKAGAPGTDIDRIPEAVQVVIKEKIKEAIVEQQVQQAVAQKVETFKAENNGAEPTADELVTIESSVDSVAIAASVNTNEINLQETFEIPEDATLSDYTL
ncbi:MAG: hypothetical protein HN610_17945 [Verrucomicrobia bacterium]|nr:hypothetical protein [Verrucomicrobiota bacterium]MBT7537447.1 hypothetical protein [Verrucomicrobiota bacterium]